MSVERTTDIEKLVIDVYRGGKLDGRIELHHLASVDIPSKYVAADDGTIDAVTFEGKIVLKADVPGEVLVRYLTSDAIEPASPVEGPTS